MDKMKPFFHIHIPRTGGVSRESILKKYCKDFQHPKTDKIKMGDSLWFGHNDPEETLRYITQEHYQKAIITTWIRDPRARLVSLYWHLNFKGTFPQFVYEIVYFPLTPIGLYANRNLSICNPQVRWIENTRIDFMGKFENMDNDWKRFCELVEIPFESLPHLNKRTQLNWRNYYDNNFLLDTVNHFYKEDLILGRYSEKI